MELSIVIRELPEEKTQKEQMARFKWLSSHCMTVLNTDKFEMDSLMASLFVFPFVA